MLRHRAGWSRPPLIMIIVVALVLAACSGAAESVRQTFSDVGADDTVAASAEAPATTVAAGDDGADEDPAVEEQSAQLGDGAIAPAAIQTTNFGRDIIFTAELEVAASDVAAATEEATRIIHSLGGIVFGQRTTGSPEPRSVLTFKVPPEDFQVALDRLGGIGELRDQTVSADDVTERIVDLESRINTAQASVERLRALLAEADTVEVIAQLENQLLERETQLETLRGQLRTLSDQVALATIVVTIIEARVNPQLDLLLTAYPGHDGTGLSCPGDPGLSIEEGSEATLCFEIVNTGDVAVDGLELSDPVLDVELDDLLVVRGDPGGRLEPGDRVMLAHAIAPGQDLRTQTTITASALDADGEPFEDVAATASIFVNAVDPGGIPTFAEGLEDSWETLITLGQIVLLVLGWLLPFLWIPLVVWLAIRAMRRRDVSTAPPSGATEEQERQPEPV